MQVPTTGGHKGPLLQVMRFLFQKTYPSKDPCGRPGAGVALERRLMSALMGATLAVALRWRCGPT